MAALTTTRVGNRIPLGDKFLQIVRVTGSTSIASPTEWIVKADIGLSKIRAAWTQIGGTDIGVNLGLNCVTGTGGTAESSDGALSVETSGALTDQLLVFVIGDA